MSVDFQLENLKFGHVREIDGHTITVIADKLECHNENKEYTVEIGSYVHLAAPKSDLIGIISGIKVVQTQVTNSNGQLLLEDRKHVLITLVGFLQSGTTFERGIERYPVIGTYTYLLTEAAIESMFSGVFENGIPIGERCQRGGGIEFARIDKLFGRHTAILGTTGSGKSWTVASLLQSAMEVMPSTRLIFLDLHDEYRNAFPEDFSRLGRKVTHLTSHNIKLPYWCLNIDELQELFISTEHSAQNQVAIFKTIVRELRVNYSNDLNISENKLSADTPVYFKFEDLLQRLRDLDTQMVDGSSASTKKQGPFHGKLTNLIMRMETISSDPRYNFLFPSERMDNQGLQELFEELLGFKNKTQMTVIDLSGLPSEILSIIVGILCRLAFEYKYWDLDPQHLPITLVLEEAHNYLPNSDFARHRICIERVERVAREGRKYGLNLMIVSQRPSELNETILSQCGNFITLRLTNPNDQAYVKKLLPDFLAVAIDMLPHLRTGEAIITGEAVELPTRVRIPRPDPHPKSQDVKYEKWWRCGVPNNYSVEQVINRWRQRVRLES